MFSVQERCIPDLVCNAHIIDMGHSYDINVGVYTDNRLLQTANNAARQIIMLIASTFAWSMCNVLSEEKQEKEINFKTRKVVDRGMEV